MLMNSLLIISLCIDAYIAVEIGYNYLPIYKKVGNSLDKMNFLRFDILIKENVDVQIMARCLEISFNYMTHIKNFK